VDARVCDPPAGCSGDRSGAACDYVVEARANDPAVVLWYQAALYCAWRGQRLPSAEEWRLAATGIDGRRKYPWGDEAPTTAGVCWRRGESERTCPVATHAQDRSVDGLFDLAANASEWLRPGDGSRRVRAVAGGNWSRDLGALMSTLNPARSDWEDLIGGFRCAQSTAQGLTQVLPASGRAAQPCPERMARVPAAESSSGSTAKASRTESCLDRTEVTNEAYERCVQAGVCDEPSSCDWREGKNPFCEYQRGDRRRHPARVRFYQASIYCAWAGKRLPSHDEWTRAASSAYGELLVRGAPPSPAEVCFRRDAQSGSCEVAVHPRDRASIDAFDLVGNEREWVWTADTRPGLRALAGGHWSATGPEGLADAAGRRVADRGASALDGGFRCAL
jgi:formylglycine-generating enzyme required for sulfatase activity